MIFDIQVENLLIIMDSGKDAGALARENRDYQRSVTTCLNRLVL